jgi:pimeloyl-ACP methyl ester carboxylesterase
MENIGHGTSFAINGAVRLAYDDLGPAAGEPLLMIMGLGASRFWWPEGLLQCLQDHFASDKPLKSMPITGSMSTKEPDLLAN